MYLTWAETSPPARRTTMSSRGIQRMLARNRSRIARPICHRILAPRCRRRRLLIKHMQLVVRPIVGQTQQQALCLKWLSSSSKIRSKPPWPARPIDKKWTRASSTRSIWEVRTTRRLMEDPITFLAAAVLLLPQIDHVSCIRIWRVTRA